jgi:hypothetical protein
VHLCQDLKTAKTIIHVSTIALEEFARFKLTPRHIADEPEISRPRATAEPSKMIKAIRIIRTPRTDVNGLPLDFYNWSNDHLYPPQKAQKVTIRQTGLIDIIHAGPALKLQMPFVSAYKE